MEFTENRQRKVLRILKDSRVKFATVSGILTTKINLIEWVDNNIPEIELITTKSYQVKPNSGNREPIIVEQNSGCYGNAVGLKNPGMQKGLEELIRLRNRHELRALLNVSLSADSIEDFILLVKGFEQVADLLELNFSCPHAGGRYGSVIGSDPATVKEFISEIRKNTHGLLFAKLTPNVCNIGNIALAAVQAGADGISAINTVGPEVFREPYTGQPVLYNPNGHKGGKSGLWIRETALQKVREIRQAVGEAVPIIGMGGITSAADVLNMKEAGADVVGPGSVIIRVPSQELLPHYFYSLKRDIEDNTNLAEELLSKQRKMEYKPYKIEHIEEKNEYLRILSLEGSIDYSSSQYAFLFIPGIGEKPFSIAGTSPLKFIIRKKGIFTKSLFTLCKGDTLLIRGVYGADSPDNDKPRACVVTGGTGIAVAPKLVEKLHRQGKEVTVYCGAASEEEIVLGKEISKYATFVPVADNGIKGRVLDVMVKELAYRNAADTCFYNIGPEQFMKIAMEIEVSLGADPMYIYASLETETMCGIGVCGSCECKGRLLCKEGTFLSLMEIGGIEAKQPFNAKKTAPV